MSVFGKNRNVVRRRVYLPKAALASVIQAPAGATNVRIYAKNSTATAVSVSAGNAAAGAQFAAVTAVGTSTVLAPAVIAPAQAGPTLVYQADGQIHVTATVAGIADVVVEYTELLNSLPLMKSGSYATGQQGVSAQ
jgi:hypothetical protein